MTIKKSYANHHCFSLFLTSSSGRCVFSPGLSHCFPTVQAGCCRIVATLALLESAVGISGISTTAISLNHACNISTTRLAFPRPAFSITSKKPLCLGRSTCFQETEISTSTTLFHQDIRTTFFRRCPYIYILCPDTTTHNLTILFPSRYLNIVAMNRFIPASRYRIAVAEKLV